MGFFESSLHTLKRINSVICVNLKNKPRASSMMQWNTVCFKLSGVSRHFCGSEELLLEPGGLLLLPKRIPYGVICEELGESIAIGFELVEDELPDKSLRLIKPDDSQKCRGLFCRMLEAHKYSERRYECFADFYELMGLICHDDGNDKMNPRIREVLEFIEHNLHDSMIDEKRLAAHCGYSVGYFRRAFTKTLGMSPIRYIIKLRMEHACSLLRSGFFTVAQVAEQVGYRDVYYFSNSFRRELGMSPTQYMGK